MVQPVNRIQHLFSSLNGQDKALKNSSLDMKELKEKAGDKLSAPKLSFGDFDNFDGDDGDDDDDYGDDDHDEGEGENDSYLADKLRLAEHDDSIITEARVIFQKDEVTGKVYMTARLEEMDLPDYFSSEGDEMFKADIILKIFGKTFTEPKKLNKPVNPNIFKKKNWQERI